MSYYCRNFSAVNMPDFNGTATVRGGQASGRDFVPVLKITNAAYVTQYVPSYLKKREPMREQ